MSVNVVSALAADSNEAQSIYYTTSGKVINLDSLEKVSEEELFDYDNSTIRAALVAIREKYPDAIDFDFYKDLNGKAYCAVYFPGGKVKIEECIQVYGERCYVYE